MRTKAARKIIRARSLHDTKTNSDLQAERVASTGSPESISVENNGKGKASDRTARLTAIAGENTIKKIWDTPEEDEAWQHL
jgi:hypothetical protein